MERTPEGKAPPASKHPKVRHFYFSVTPMDPQESDVAVDNEDEILASAFANLEQRSAPQDFVSQMQAKLAAEPPVVTPWQEPDLGDSVTVEREQEQTVKVKDKKKKRKAKRKQEEEKPADEKEKAGEEAVDKAKRHKQRPPKRDAKHKGENVRMRTISEQRSDTPHAAHKTKAETRVREIEREEYFSANVESFVLGAAVRAKPSPSEAKEQYEKILEKAATLPLRTGSDKMCIVFCDQLLVDTFDHLGASSKAATVTSLTLTDRDAMTPPATLSEALAASQNSTVMRTTTSDLYMVQKRMCSPNGVVVPPSVRAFTPLEQLELDRIRSVQKAHKGGDEEEDKSTRRQLEKLRPSVLSAQRSVMEGKYRVPLLQSVAPLYDNFERKVLHAGSESKPSLSFVMRAEDLETCLNLESTALAELAVCAHRLKTERERETKKSASANDVEEENGDEQEESSKKGKKKANGKATPRYASHRGRTVDPFYKKAIAA